MMSSRNSIVALLICWSLIAAIKTEGITQRQADFGTIFNGIWDNKDQVKERSGFDFLQVHIKPVDIPALRPLYSSQNDFDVDITYNTTTERCQIIARVHTATVVYVEEAINGIINVINLAVVTEGSDGNIYLTRYNVTHEPGLKFGSFNTDDLANITMNDLDGSRNCTTQFEQTESNVFVGEWEACNYIVNEQHPKYTLIFTCTHHAASIPLNIKEATTRLPYEFKHRKRYPLLFQVPDNYVSPCAGFD